MVRVDAPWRGGDTGAEPPWRTVPHRFRIAAGTTVGAFLDVLNLTNANPEQQVITTSGPNFLRPTQVLSPRILRLGTRLEW